MLFLFVVSTNICFSQSPLWTQAQLQSWSVSHPVTTGNNSILQQVNNIQSLTAVTGNPSSVWYFGSDAGLDFKTDPPTVLLDGKVNTSEGCASISDTSGNLLFSTDGITIWAKDQSVMPNGTSLLGNPSSTQSAIIVPAPGNANLYYVFAVNATPNATVTYSIVDITLNGGLGNVNSTKNQVLLSGTEEVVTSIKATNGNYWWIVTHKSLTNSYYAFKLTTSGLDIANPVISSVGFTTTVSGGEIGYLKANSQGTQIAECFYISGAKCQVFDFDANTGIVSNPNIISQAQAYGCEFSPNGHLLYVSSWESTFKQYDLTNSNSAYTLTTGANAAVQLGPNGKIYVANYNGTSLGVISNPDVVGSGCNYNTNGQSLGGKVSQGGLPNIIASFVATQLNPPPVPVATAATSVIATGFAANWNASTGATGYYLDIATDNSFTNFVSGYNNKDVSNVTTYSISALTTGTTYYYRIRAYNTNGTSGNSNIIMVTTSSNIPSLTNSTAVDTFAIGSSSGIVIDPNVIVTASDTSTTLSNAVVYINTNFVASDDQLIYPASLFGVTGSYDAAKGILTLSGTASVNEYQQILRTIQYKNTNSSATAGNRTYTFSLGNATPFTPCGASVPHYYKFYSNPGITWTAAQTAAAATNYFGLQGYLVTIMCAAENAFAFNAIGQSGWIGASDVATLGVWNWMTGPEAGENFYNGCYCNSQSGGTTVNGFYSNWNPGEPNNSGGVERYAQFLPGTTDGFWNDLANTTTVDGYYVEYGGMTGDPSINISGTKNMTLIQLSAPIATAATLIIPTGFTANWDSVATATGYYLDVATDSAFTSFVSGYNNKDVSNVLTYTLSGLTDSTKYYYRVRAYNTNGTTVNSNIISLLTAGPCPDITYSTNNVVLTQNVAMSSLVPTNTGAVINVGGGGTPIIISAPEKGYYDFPFTESGLTVTLSGTGSFTNYNNSAFTSCNVTTKDSSIWVGNGVGTMTNTFSSPVNDLIYKITATGQGEIMTITTDVGGAVTLSYVNGNCASNFNFNGGQISVNSGGNEGGEIKVHCANAFQSITYSHNGAAAGSLYTLDMSQLVSGGTSGGNGSWSIAPALPAGLVFDTLTGTISGTPTTVMSATVYTVTGTANNCNSTFPITLTVNYPTPDAPVATPATVVTSTGFTANWNSSANATGYYLDVATDNGFTNFVPGDSNLNVNNVTSYALTGLTTGTTYYYRIRAYNISGTSVNSNIISVTPEAPVATPATLMTTTGFSANWNSSLGATGYYLDVASNSAFTNFATGYQNLDVSNITTYPVSGLIAGTIYYYRVRAYNALATSINSNVITTITVPAPPVATAATLITATNFTANWNSTTGASGYLLDVATDSNFTNYIFAYNNNDVTNVTSYLVNGGISGGTIYYYRLRAYNASGISANSNVICTAPNPPVAIAATNVTMYSFDANWLLTIGAVAYKIDVATDPDFEFIINPYNNLSTGDVTTYTISGLNANTPYYYRVRAINSAGGTSINSNVIMVKRCPIITWSNPADIIYGTPLSTTQLNATVNVPGTSIYSPASGTILNTGANHDLLVTFTPTDTANYNVITKIVQINVIKADPVITWANPADINYGTLLSSTQLNATASVPGTFIYSPFIGTLLPAGANQNLSVTFTPTDENNYNSASKMVQINVIKATLVVKADDKMITYGEAIPTFTYTISGFVNGESNSVISGSPLLSSTATSSSDVGTYPINITVGTIVASNYSLTFTNGVLTIGKADQTISIAPIPDQYIGNSFNPGAVASSGLPVTYEVSPYTVAKVVGNTISVLGAGEATLTIIQSGNNDYNPATETVTFMAMDIKFSNFITPNGDGHNDTWSVPKDAEFMAGADVTIYDSYGQQLFKTTGYGEWDGKYNSKVCPTGEYYFVVKTASGSTYKGVILLMK